MVDGNKLWNDIDISDLIVKELSNGWKVTAYRSLPDNLYEVLVATAGMYADKTAIIDNFGRSYTYADMLRMTDSLASYLYYTRNVRKGTHVAMVLYSSMEFCVAFFALTKLGAVIIPLPTRYKKSEVLSLADKADLKLIICESQLQQWFEDWDGKKYCDILVTADAEFGYGFESCTMGENLPVKNMAGSEDNSIIIFTSGTTSQSKGVLIKNYSIMHAIASYQKILKLTSEDISIIPIPIYNITGVVALMGLFVYIGGTLYLHKAFSPKRVLECVVRNNVTFLHASPTVFTLLLQYREQFPCLPSLKSFACGSSNMPKELLIKIHEWIPQLVFHTVYGLTETTSPAAIFPGDVTTSGYIGSSGRPIPGTQFKIVDEAGNEMPCDQIGEILIRGTVVTQNYYKLDSDLIDAEGWLKTGDMGYFNPEGYLYVVDRKKDMINRGGEKIWCFDVENELYRINGIVEAAVVSIPHEIYGEVAGAVVKVRESCNLDEEAIKKELQVNLAHYMVPERILILQEIPHTPNGKTDKKEIRKLFNTGVM